ncbi:transposase [Weissella paramesenteroides]
MPHSTISRPWPLLHQIIDLAKRDVSEKDIAYILHISHSKVNRLLHHAAKACRTNYTKPLPTVICVDEVLYAKHHYGFEMINGMTSDLIEIFPTRTSIDIRRYLSNRQHVQYVVTDMNTNYAVSLRAMFPNAQIIIDRFHIIQLAMKAVQSTRITLQRTIDNKHSRVYKLLKSNWQFFITDQS